MESEATGTLKTDMAHHTKDTRRGDRNLDKRHGKTRRGDRETERVGLLDKDHAREA